jgi:hypothetical protein
MGHSSAARSQRLVSACQPDDETGSGCGDAGDGAGIDGVLLAVLRQDQRID